MFCNTNTMDYIILFTKKANCYLPESKNQIHMVNHDLLYIVNGQSVTLSFRHKRLNTHWFPAYSTWVRMKYSFCDTKTDFIISFTNKTVVFCQGLKTEFILGMLDCLEFLNTLKWSHTKMIVFFSFSIFYTKMIVHFSVNSL